MPKVTWNFPFTGGIQIFVVPCSGVYKFEVWGAEGGKSLGLGSGGGNIGPGGFGGYSKGFYNAKKGQILYVYVGGKGEDQTTNTPNNGGWNGGGSSTTKWSNYYQPTGGGSTDISLVRSEITIDSSRRSVRQYSSYASRLIVAGGGGAGCSRSSSYSGTGGHGGGYKGTSGLRGKTMYIGYGGDQTSPGQTSYSTAKSGEFGMGNPLGIIADGACSGSGWYGGGQGVDAGAGGGSGYIVKVKNYGTQLKGMWCYSCETSASDDTRTTSTNQYSSSPLENTAKSGHGFAKITSENVTIETNINNGYCKTLIQILIGPLMSDFKKA